ncbi:unnamed protein product [Peniophora sp. CBMAI 1063]|nr:unnamed protein product [Peniophora sp. CBMAI 1063]
MSEDTESEVSFHTVTSGSNTGEAVTTSIISNANPDMATLPIDSLSNRSSALRASTPSRPDNPDPARHIKGMYRVLDLIVEQGSGGLVDKIIIFQEGVQEFVEDIYPGAYTSMTRIDFKALDNLLLKPIGIYGSKHELVRFLGTLGSIDDEIARRLLGQDKNDHGEDESLRSGLYIVRSPHEQGGIFVVYWPEATTWDDGAASTVRRNRVTFMRYLTKLTDQVVALISDAHAEKLVWKETTSADTETSSDEDESDRLFTFQVSKTVAQEENVTARPGFRMTLPAGIELHPSRSTLDGALYRTKLVRGETTQALMVPLLKDQRIRTQAWDKAQGPVPVAVIREFLANADQIVLSESLDLRALRALADCGLSTRFPTLFSKWQRCHDDLSAKYTLEKKQLLGDANSRLAANDDHLRDVIRESYIKSLVHIYPFLDTRELGGERYRDLKVEAGGQAPDIVDGYGEEARKVWSENAKWDNLGHEFNALKERFLVAWYIIHEECLDLPKFTRRALCDAILVDEHRPMEAILTDALGRSEKAKSWGATFASVVVSRAKSAAKNLVPQGLVPPAMFDKGPAAEANKIMLRARQKEILTLTPNFLLSLGGFAEADFAKAKTAVEEKARLALARLLDDRARRATLAIAAIHRNRAEHEVEQRLNFEYGPISRGYDQDLIRGLAQVTSIVDRRVTINVFEPLKRSPHSHHTRSAEYYVDGHAEWQQRAEVQYTILKFELSEADNHSLSESVLHVPTPALNIHQRQDFNLPRDQEIIFSQLLPGDRLLIVVRDETNAQFMFYLERLGHMNAAVRRAPAKKVHMGKTGPDILIACDETTRQLCLVSSERLKVVTFLFDEHFVTIHTFGSELDLSAWYPHGTRICHVAFAIGREEILFIDSSSLARLFSLVTLQFKPATLQLPSVPSDVFASPDGACLIVCLNSPTGSSLVAYHWATFEASESKTIDMPASPIRDSIMTSFSRRAAVHLVSLDLETRACSSIALSITQKATEFTFSRRDKTHHPAQAGVLTHHNSLFDCHADVWTRFPVVAAIRRRTVDSSRRRNKAFQFVSAREHDHPAVALYFKQMITDFEKRTRKPTNRELDLIDITAATYDHFETSLTRTLWECASSLHTGEWLVDLFCLIPIQLAVCRDNQFCPMKDGVLSADFERSLLGADVTTIVDFLSFGWYESLFQSYLAAKPVKVVSSMGEQSVGKSYALNHLVDTSFAGSAMRTTEGVWMSLTPTDDTLIVALDFEGVHSIERSAQEDALLVLLNTALSSLVLFRNNFSLSRDIAGLFQSFQSSSSILDPASNPHLFQSTLAIVIRDVTDTDKDEIYREFSLKFERIVHEERDANFITKLHSGKLDIIPWPVIESKQFYKMFSILKKRLDQQATAHASAGGFLLTMKTLMAKLKANDWGAMSQTLASHRAKTLHSMLDRALCSGVAELEPDIEPLKNLDTDVVIDCRDSDTHFFLSSAGSDSRQRELMLGDMMHLWDDFDRRHTMADTEFFSALTRHITELVDMRINHVRQWVDENLMRFQTSHDSIDGLRRTLEAAIIDLKAGTQLCGSHCASCGLLCLMGRSHDESLPHDCHTTHECIHDCSYCASADLSTPGPVRVCGMKAGHSGRHICTVNSHLCGEPCKLLGTKGCLSGCMKMPGHEDAEHACSASLHKCGKPCALIGIGQPSGKPYSCSGTCDIAFGEEHTEHACEMRECPMSCQLCKRLCANSHLHGLEADSLHLCGQEHSCNALCSAGICQIETKPHEVHATFAGRNETFQYTKYTQVTKRNQCCKTIERGRLDHDGPHLHGVEKDLFHYCDRQCNDCGYYCTLPHGHAQDQHETSHGSMSQTRWAVDGEDGTSIEVNGRKFSANDDGAPMLCSMICSELGRHIHVDYCRSTDGSPCNTADVEHITSQMSPNPRRPKDAVTHALYWRRSGFKDPYSNELQTTFAKCDAMCPDTEHTSAAAAGDRQPSYCTLPMFHAPAAVPPVSALGEQGYVSSDGHAFTCTNPVSLHPAYHVIFAIDKSGSMASTDRSPLAGTPVTNAIVRVSNNRLGAVCSALHAFWTARQANARLSSGTARRDAYSVLMFDTTVVHGVVNDVSSSPEELLQLMLRHRASGGTSFNNALDAARVVMEQNWSADRKPVVIFLSDGHDQADEGIVRNLCQTALRLGDPLSLHTVSFGPASSESSLRTIARIATQVQERANQAQGAGLRRNTASSGFSEALNSVTLAETFLAIAESLRKPRGSLLR